MESPALPPSPAPAVAGEATDGAPCTAAFLPMVEAYPPAAPAPVSAAAAAPAAPAAPATASLDADLPRAEAAAGGGVSPLPKVRRLFVGFS